MKTIIRTRIFRALLVAVLMAAALPAIAYDFMVDGIAYSINEDGASVTVTGYDGQSYVDVIIPNVVSNENSDYTVTAVGDNAFRSTRINSVVLGDNIKTIGEFAFESCYFNRITIGENLEKIGWSAFYMSNLNSVIVKDLNKWFDIEFVSPNSNPLSCRAYLYDRDSVMITNLVVPQGVEEIKKNAFYGCLSLNTLQLNDDLKRIRNGAFKACGYLTELTVPNSVDTIEEEAFYQCYNMAKVTFGNGLKKLGIRSFGELHNLSEFCVDDLSQWCGVEIEYDGNPLRWANHLTVGGEVIDELVIPYGVEVINTYVFEGGTFSKITIPETVTTIGTSAFSRCTGVQELIWKARDCSTSGSLSCENIEKLTIGDEVTQLPLSFAYNTKIKGLVIPGSLKKIGHRAFYNTTSLNSLILEEGVEEIESEAFSGCKIKELVIPNSLLRLNESAFSYCEQLHTLTLGRSLEMVGGAFYKCENVKKIVLNSINLTSIVLVAPLLNELVISDEVKRIPSFLCNESLLESVDLPSSVEYIGAHAFQRSNSLKQVRMGDSVKAIEESAFWSCENLEEINIPNSVQTIGDGALSNTSLECIVLPESVKEISNNLFAGCNKLISVVMGDSVTNIGSNAFINCTKLNSIVLPESLQTINYGAFHNCTNMSVINSKIINPNTVNLTGDVFYGIDKEHCVLNVPVGSAEIYRKTNIWKSFNNILESEFTNVPADVNGDYVINAADVTSLYNILLGDEGAVTGAGDVDGDGHVTSADITAIYNKLLGE